MKKTVIKRQNPDSQAKKTISWKPAGRLGDFTTPEGYRARWVHDTPDNIAKKEAEGWIILNKTKFPNLKGGGNYERQVTDSQGETSTVLKRNELVAMILPEEDALARTAYYEQETAERTQSALSHSEVKKLLSKGDPRAARNVVSYNPDGISTIE